MKGLTLKVIHEMGSVLGDLGALEKGEGELVCVESEGEDGTWRSPGADHEMMDWHFEFLR